MITTLLTRGAVIAVPAPSSSARQAGSGPSEKNIPAAGPGSGEAEAHLGPQAVYSAGGASISLQAPKPGSPDHTAPETPESSGKASGTREKGKK